ncbi:MAG: elongation factor P maturation arginine rhamnosyltransferase EarP [Hydrogenophaga sp.]
MRWDLFCRVIDNLGDIGVCWRLCADLASRGEQVRLWIDQPDALAWMAPGALEGRWPGVQVVRWTDTLPAEVIESWPPADVWVEAFGCDPAQGCVWTLADRLAQGASPPVWINLEYMSAEPWVERSHGLPSPVMSGPLKGLTKWFFFPGFTPATGGLLREPDLARRQAAFDHQAWRVAMGLPRSGSRCVSLFCYEPPALCQVLTQAGGSDWLVTPGRAWQAVAACPAGPSAARVHALPPVTQREFDHLLWACDLNCVRGEDSLVRALWAGRPLVWHIYRQHDDAHHAKLNAFLDWLDAPASLRRFHHAWNGLTAPEAAVWPDEPTLADWSVCAVAARQRLLAQTDLATQLTGFVTEKR